MTTKEKIALIRNITADPTDPDCHDILDALGEMLIENAFTIHQEPGDRDEDNAIRAAVRAIFEPLSDDFDSKTTALNAIHAALHEIEERGTVDETEEQDDT